MTVSAPIQETRPIEIVCSDGVVLGGHFWPRVRGATAGTAIINPATGVLARYYHHYARFLAAHGFDVVTYDYRGIGASRPASMRGCNHRWRQWGEKDFEAVLAWVLGRDASAPVSVVGHSVGGALPGLAGNARAIHRLLSVGGQFGCWRHYAPACRARLFLKWHVAMPVLTALFGYFPGRRLGWLEDLPAGIAYEWAFRRPRVEDNYPEAERDAILRRFDAMTAPILAVTMSDDEIATVPAIRTVLDRYRGAQRTQVLLQPADLGQEAVGHFSLFHNRHATGFWLDTLLWLRDGINPWPDREVGRGRAFSLLP